MLLEFGGKHQVAAITEILKKKIIVHFHYDLQKCPRVVEVNLLS